MDLDYFSEQSRDLQSASGGPDNEQAIQDPEMPLLEPLPRETASARTPACMDVEMADSSSSTRGSQSGPNYDTESDRDAIEIEMQAVTGDDTDDPPLPEIELLDPPRSSNRRARVDDDEDDERDRRHPTERLTNPPSRQSTRPATPLHPNIRSNVNNTPASPVSEARGRRQPPFMTGGIAFTLDLEAMPFPFAPRQAPREEQPGHTQGRGQDAPRIPEGFEGGHTFADLLNDPSFLNVLGIEPAIDDPDRAERLLSGLEEVPVGLVRRLERVGGMAGSSGGELSGGDSGCAVCWEKLLEVDVSSIKEDVMDVKQKSKEEEVVEKQHPRVVSLPCAHVFHAECLRPWFSQPKQTTCPTCRFNIDPENLTFVSYRQRQRQAQAHTPAPGGSTAEPAAAPAASIPGPSSESSSSSASAVPPSIGPTLGAESRGRTASTDRYQRRAGSEPPRNRVPRPGPLPDMMQSFAVPGGHVVIVSQPINFMGQPIGGASRQPSQDNAQSHIPPSPPTASSTSPAQEQRPLFGSPPQPPGVGGMPPLPGNLPEAFFAFDIHFPIHPSLSRAAGGETINPSDRQTFPNFLSNMLQGVEAAGAQRPAHPDAPQPSVASTNVTAVPISPSDVIGEMQANTQSSQASANATPEPASLTAGGGTGTQPSNGDEASQRAGDFARILASYLNHPAVLLRLLSASMGNAPGFGFGLGGTAEPRGFVKKDWTLPPAPGPTLRQRVERREREAGLRCSDISCGIGPSDEDPFIALGEPATKQTSIHPAGDVTNKVCVHKFHSACLVSAERVVLRGVDPSIIGNDVAVSCPVCRGIGCVSRAEWDEGVFTLQ